MGNKHTADGRWIVGNGNSGDDYKGFLHWRECYICLTENGATEESVNYLNALKEYALAHYALGESIMPPSMTVWVVANGKATAVQADDVKVEDGDYTICGITYSDGAWDYSNAGQGGGGDPGYTVEETKQTVIAEQTITGTSITGGSYSTIIADPDISAISDGTIVTVTFDGTAYDVPAQDMSGECFLLGEVSGGSPVYTNYPFVIMLASTQAQVIKYGADPVVIKAEVLSKTVTPSDDFKAAVEASGSGGILRVSFGWDEQADTDTADKTFAEIWSAINAGKTVVGIDDYEGEVTNLELVSYSGSNLVFCGINMRKAMLHSGATLMFVQYKISSDDQVTSDSQEYTLTPSNGSGAEMEG